MCIDIGLAYCVNCLIDFLSHIVKYMCNLILVGFKEKYRMELIDKKYDLEHRARWMAEEKQVHNDHCSSYEIITWTCNVLTCNFVCRSFHRCG